MLSGAMVYGVGGRAGDVRCNQRSEFGAVGETEPDPGADAGTEYGRHCKMESEAQPVSSDDGVPAQRSDFSTGAEGGARHPQHEAELSFIVHISDEDYRSAWRPCLAFESETPEN